MIYYILKVFLITHELYRSSGCRVIMIMCFQKQLMHFKNNFLKVNNDQHLGSEAYKLQTDKKRWLMLCCFLHESTLGSYCSSDRKNFTQCAIRLQNGCVCMSVIDLCLMILKYIDFQIQFIAI